MELVFDYRSWDVLEAEPETEIQMHEGLRMQDGKVAV